MTICQWSKKNLKSMKSALATYFLGDFFSKQLMKESCQVAVSNLSLEM